MNDLKIKSYELAYTEAVAAWIELADGLHAIVQESGVKDSPSAARTLTRKAIHQAVRVCVFDGGVDASLVDDTGERLMLQVKSGPSQTVKPVLAKDSSDVNVGSPQIPQGASPWVDKLLDILNGPSSAARTAIQTNLQVFSAYVQAVREVDEAGEEPSNLSRRIKEGLVMADREVAKAAAVVYGKKRPPKGEGGDLPNTGSDKPGT